MVGFLTDVALAYFMVDVWKWLFFGSSAVILFLLFTRPKCD
jgi:hypothetical protein